MARKDIVAPEEEGCPLWVVTFGDAMSLLVTFFVMLVSFADFEEHSLQQVFGALKGGLRAVPVPFAEAMGGLPVEEITADVTQSEEADPEAKLADEALVDAESADRIVRTSSTDYYIHLLANGISLVINRQAVFEPGTATLSSSNHEVWAVARDMMRVVRNEIQVSVTLPENVVVRMDNYSTAWGLGIEQSVRVKELLVEGRPGRMGQVSTAVRVLKTMPPGAPREGMVEIVFVGFNESQMKGIPSKILRESWRRTPEKAKGADDGQEN